MKESYFNLDENAPLFQELEKEPLWWNFIKSDKDLYFNIRKDNRLNVYYRGASIMSLSYKDGDFKADIHNYYLGVDKKIADKFGYTYGNVTLSPEDIVVKLGIIKERVNSNKKNKGEIVELDDNNPENYSEKYIQAELYKKGGFIDTEFALSLDDNTQIQIDLVKLTNSGKIQFVELKRVQDDRLSEHIGKPAEIITQIDNYNRFLNECDTLSKERGYDVILRYYNKVLKIMENIGIIPCNVVPRTIVDRSNYVELFIEGYSKKDRGNRRANRLMKIQKICEENNIHSNIKSVIENFKMI